MKRVDLATPIHKAVRKVLFDQVLLFARTDFTLDTERSHSLLELEKAIALLREHGEHEDVVVFPELEHSDEALFRECERQHLELERGFRELEWLAATLAQVTPSERELSAQRLVRRFQAFVVEQLQHLAFEETEGNAALWRRLTDAQLLEMRARILSRVPPERAETWQKLVALTANASELREMAALAALSA